MTKQGLKIVLAEKRDFGTGHRLKLSCRNVVIYLRSVDQILDLAAERKHFSILRHGKLR